MKADVASEWKARRLYAGDALKRQPGAGEVENGLTVGIVGEISGQQAGWRRIRIRGRWRQQTQLGIGNAHFAVMQGDFTPRSIETPAPGLRNDYIEKAGELRVGVRSAAMERAAQQAVRWVGVSEQRL